MAKTSKKRKASKSTSASGAAASSTDASSGNGWGSLPWKSLASANTTIADDKDDEHDDNIDPSNQAFDEDDAGYNHYDDESADWTELYGDANSSFGKKGKKGNDDDNAFAGADDPGILFGLEVVDGGMYEVKREKVGGSGAEVTRVVPKSAALGSSNTDAILAAKKPSKTRKLNASNNKKQQQQKNIDDEVDANSNSDGDSDGDEKNLADIQREIRRLEKAAKRKEAKLRKKEKKKKQQQEGGRTATKDESNTANKSKKKKKKKNDNANDDVSTPEATQQETSTIQTSWSVAAPGVYLHEALCQGLAIQKFAMPTPIQSSTLPASILGRRDIVGAAPTGSGKTLAYALPMLQGILAARDERKASVDDNDGSGSDSDCKEHDREPLTGLVLCPTRELAVQVTAEVKKVACNEVDVATIVGGLAEQKQKRVLDVKRPPIVVATPGRLWELMLSKDHPHLMDLTNLRYLIVDEADRMINQGSFPQLTKIFDEINKANQPPEEKGMSDYEEEDEDDPDRLRSLPGIRGEAKVTMLDDRLLAMIRRQEKGGSLSNEDESPPEQQEVDDDEYEEKFDQQQQSKQNRKQGVHRQTFVYSATLTLPPSSHRSLETVTKPLPNKKCKKQKQQSVDGAIAEIMERAGARGLIKVVDLTSANDEAGKKGANESSSSSPSRDAKARPQRSQKLPPGLSLYEVKCTQMHKDMHLYAYLATTKIGSSGPCLVFCNSIAAVRRVGETLKSLRLPVRMLHAQMAQKARMSALESINKPKSRSIVVATDVAARGLDISSVSTVVHYDVPRAIDTFIHRAGRTARGVGEEAVGSSISFVSPSEEKAQRAICEALYGSASSGAFEAIPMDGRLLSAAQERTNLAARIVECENIETKASKKNQWFIEAAEAAGLDLDEDLLDGGLMDGVHRDRQKLSEARKAKQTLNALLAQPMRTQQFGKFLSGAGLKAAIQAEKDVTPYVVEQASGKSKKKKKRKKQKSER